MGTRYYRLIVPEGLYESDSLIGLLLEVFRHRLDHLVKHGKWMDGWETRRRRGGSWRTPRRSRSTR